MERGCKVAIYKLKKVEPVNSPPFYNATVVEKVYNTKNPRKWESSFYECYIFNMDLNLEPADFSLNVNEKDKYSYDNIANPDKSIIRVIDFKFENHTVWYGNNQQKDDYGKPIIKPIFYLLEIEPNSKQWVGEERKSKKLQEQIDRLIERNKQKEQKLNDIIAGLREEIASLRREVSKRDTIIDKKENKIIEAKNEIKNANREVGVYKRKHTMTEKQLSKTQNKLEETNQDLVRVKKMKKAEVIQKANEFIENDFDFGTL